MIAVDPLLGVRVRAVHDFAGAVEGVVVGAFVSERASGDKSMGELVLVVMDDDGVLLTVDADGAQRAERKSAPRVQ